MNNSPKIKRVHYLYELKELAKKLGVRDDWHEPDEQDVSAVVLGQKFDNAGFWGLDLHGGFTQVDGELFVLLVHDGRPVATVNLATLFAWAVNGDKIDEVRAPKIPRKKKEYV